MAISGKRIVLQNNQALRSLDQNGDVQELLKLDQSGQIAGKVKEYVDDQHAADAAAIAALQLETGALDGRLDVLEGTDSVPGSVAHAVKEEHDRAMAAESALEGQISSEQSARETAIQSEAQTRAAADTALDGRLTTVEQGLAQEVTDRNSAITFAVNTEKSARESADMALDGRLTTVEAGLAQEVVDRGSAISSAVAPKADKTYVDSQLGLKLNSSEVGVTVASLDSQGKIPMSQVPGIAISSTFVVDSEANMLALICEEGDVCVRTDLSKSYILAGQDPSVLSNWQELLSPTFDSTGLQTQISGLDTRVNSLEVAMPTKASQTSLDSEISCAQSAESALDTRLLAAEADLATKASSADLDQEIVDRENAVNALSGRLDAIEQFNFPVQEYVAVTLSAAQINDEQVVLDYAMIGAPMVICEGIMLIANQDYFYNGNIIDFAGDTAFGGAAALIAGDRLDIYYFRNSQSLMPSGGGGGGGGSSPTILGYSITNPGTGTMAFDPTRTNPVDWVYFKMTGYSNSGSITIGEVSAGGSWGIGFPVAAFSLFNASVFNYVVGMIENEVRRIDLSDGTFYIVQCLGVLPSA